MHVVDERPRASGDQPAIYLAASFARRDELKEYAAELVDLGFLVTSRWLDSSAKLGADDLHPSGRGGQVALMDLQDVCDADICVAFTESPEAKERGRGGRHTELGIALGLGHQVLVVGPREHVFHCLPHVLHRPDWGSARSWLLSRASRQTAA